jgi:hypothetical protein
VCLFQVGLAADCMAGQLMQQRIGEWLTRSSSDTCVPTLAFAESLHNRESH